MVSHSTMSIQHNPEIMTILSRLNGQAVIKVVRGQIPLASVC
jgi:hypothetical protein